MNVGRIAEIIALTTMEFRTGAEVAHTTINAIETIELWDIPHYADAPPDLLIVDVHFIKVGVDVAVAQGLKGELCDLVLAYPRIMNGPSYVEMGAELGSQDLALRLFALGEALDMWKVVTPASMGIIERDYADKLAGFGMVMITGYKT